MNFMFNLSGANAPFIKEYNIASDCNIALGEVVGITDGVVVKALGADAILGVSAEHHSGKEDILNARACGTKIRVLCSPDAVYSAKAPEYTVLTATQTTLRIPSIGLSSTLNSGYAVLVSKAENSLNTDAIGTARRISACAVEGDFATITLSAGSIAQSGDVYMILPDIGQKLALDTTACGVCFYNSSSSCVLTCVSACEKTGNIGVKLDNTIFA